jgi:hypothetical protein
MQDRPVVQVRSLDEGKVMTDWNKKSGLPDYEPRIVGTHKGKNGQKYPTKLCHLDYCPERMYARGLCHWHYEQIRQGGELRPRLNTIPERPCAFAGCKNNSTSKTGKGIYCQGHMNHLVAGKELKPLVFYTNEGFTESGRVCKNCSQEKPLDEFYRRNQWKKEDAKSKSTQCKECFRQDVEYYQGKVNQKADGTDPRGWQDDPEAMEARFREWQDANRARSAAYRENKKARNA